MASSDQHRTEIAATLLTESDVLVRQKVDHGELESLRRARKLLTVWFPPSNSYLYPPFQFARSGLIEEVEAILRLIQPWTTNDTGWGEVEWFLTPHNWLDGRSPAEVLPLEPARVLEVADREFSQDPNAVW